MTDNKFMGAWAGGDDSHHLRHLNRINGVKPVSARVWSVFVGIAALGGLYIFAAIAAAFFNYPV